MSEIINQVTYSSALAMASQEPGHPSSTADANVKQSEDRRKSVGRPPNQRVNMAKILDVNSLLPRNISAERRCFPPIPLGAQLQEEERAAFQQMLRNNTRNLPDTNIAEESNVPPLPQSSARNIRSKKLKSVEKEPSDLSEPSEFLSPLIDVSGKKVFVLRGKEDEPTSTTLESSWQPSPKKRKYYQPNPYSEPLPVHSEWTDLDDSFAQVLKYGKPRILKEEYVECVEETVESEDYGEAGPSGLHTSFEQSFEPEEEFVDVISADESFAASPQSDFVAPPQSKTRLPPIPKKGLSRTEREQLRSARSLLYGGWMRGQMTEIIVPSHIKAFAKTVPPPGPAKNPGGRKGANRRYQPGLVEVIKSQAQLDVPVLVRTEDGDLNPLNVEGVPAPSSSQNFEFKTPVAEPVAVIIPSNPARTTPSTAPSITTSTARSQPRFFLANGRPVTTPLPYQKPCGKTADFVSSSQKNQEEYEVEKLEIREPAIPRLMSPPKAARTGTVRMKPIVKHQYGRLNVSLTPFRNPRKLSSYTKEEQEYIRAQFPDIDERHFISFSPSPVKLKTPMVAPSPRPATAKKERILPATLWNGTRIRLVPFDFVSAEAKEKQTLYAANHQPAIMKTNEGQTLVYSLLEKPLTSVKSVVGLSPADLIFLDDFEDERGAPRGMKVFFDQRFQYDQGPGDVEPSKFVTKAMKGDTLHLETPPSTYGPPDVGSLKEFKAVLADSPEVVPKPTSTSLGFREPSISRAQQRKQRHALVATEDEEAAKIEAIIRTGKIATHCQEENKKAATCGGRKRKRVTVEVENVSAHEKGKENEEIAVVPKAPKKRAVVKELLQRPISTRGRKPKPKRGRPQRKVDPNEPPKEKRPIGRPRKNPPPTEEELKAKKKKEEERQKLIAFHNRLSAIKLKFAKRRQPHRSGAGNRRLKKGEKLVNGAIQRPNIIGKGRPRRIHFVGGLPWLSKTEKMHYLRLIDLNSDWVTGVERVLGGFCIKYEEPTTKKKRVRRSKPLIAPQPQRHSRRLREKAEQGIELIPQVIARRGRRRTEVEELVKWLVDKTVKSLTPKRQKEEGFFLFASVRNRAVVEEKVFRFFMKQKLIPYWANAELEEKLRSKLRQQGKTPTVEPIPEQPVNENEEERIETFEAMASHLQTEALEVLAEVAVAADEIERQHEGELVFVSPEGKKLWVQATVKESPPVRQSRLRQKREDAPKAVIPLRSHNEAHKRTKWATDIKLLAEYFRGWMWRHEELTAVGPVTVRTDVTEELTMKPVGVLRKAVHLRSATESIKETRFSLPPAFRYVTEVLKLMEYLEKRVEEALQGDEFRKEVRVVKHEKELLRVLDLAIDMQRKMLKHMISVIGLRLLDPSRLCRLKYLNVFDHEQLKKKVEAVLNLVTSGSPSVKWRKEFVMKVNGRKRGQRVWPDRNYDEKIFLLLTGAIAGASFKESLKLHSSASIKKSAALQFDEYEFVFKTLTQKDASKWLGFLDETFETDRKTAKFVLSCLTLEAWNAASDDMKKEFELQKLAMRYPVDLRSDEGVAESLFLEQLSRWTNWKKTLLGWNLFEMADIVSSPLLQVIITETLRDVMEFGRGIHERHFYKHILLPRFQSTLEECEEVWMRLINEWTPRKSSLKAEQLNTKMLESMKTVVEGGQVFVCSESATVKETLELANRKALSPDGNMDRTNVSFTHPPPLDIQGAYFTYDLNCEVQNNEVEALEDLLSRLVNGCQERRRWRRRLLDECMKSEHLDSFAFFTPLPFTSGERKLRKEVEFVVDLGWRKLKTLLKMAVIPPPALRKKQIADALEELHVEDIDNVTSPGSEILDLSVPKKKIVRVIKENLDVDLEKNGADDAASLVIKVRGRQHASAISVNFVALPERQRMLEVQPNGETWDEFFSAIEAMEARQALNKGTDPIIPAISNRVADLKETIASKSRSRGNTPKLSTPPRNPLRSPPPVDEKPLFQDDFFAKIRRQGSSIQNLSRETLAALAKEQQEGESEEEEEEASEEDEKADNFFSLLGAFLHTQQQQQRRRNSSRSPTEANVATTSSLGLEEEVEDEEIDVVSTDRMEPLKRLEHCGLEEEAPEDDKEKRLKIYEMHTEDGTTEQKLSGMLIYRRKIANGSGRKEVERRKMGLSEFGLEEEAEDSDDPSTSKQKSQRKKKKH